MTEIINTEEWFSAQKQKDVGIFELIKPKGIVTIQQTNTETGETITQTVDNITTLIGKNWFLDMWRQRTNVSGLTTSLGYIAVGNGSAALTASQTAIGAELSQASGGRALVDTITRANSSSGISFACTFSTSGAIDPAVNETGLFATGYDSDEATLKTASITTDSGIMVARANFVARNKTSTDTLTITWSLVMQV